MKFSIPDERMNWQTAAPPHVECETQSDAIICLRAALDWVKRHRDGIKPERQNVFKDASDSIARAEYLLNCS